MGGTETETDVSEKQDDHDNKIKDFVEKYDNIFIGINQKDNILKYRDTGHRINIDNIEYEIYNIENNNFNKISEQFENIYKNVGYAAFTKNNNDSFLNITNIKNQSGKDIEQIFKNELELIDFNIKL